VGPWWGLFFFRLDPKLAVRGVPVQSTRVGAGFGLGSLQRIGQLARAEENAFATPTSPHAGRFPARSLRVEVGRFGNRAGRWSFGRREQRWLAGCLQTDSGVHGLREAVWGERHVGAKRRGLRRRLLRLSRSVDPGRLVSKRYVANGCLRGVRAMGHGSRLLFLLRRRLRSGSLDLFNHELSGWRMTAERRPPPDVVLR
jgi:hypothetical protein